MWANEKLKTSVLDGPSDQIQKFTKLHYCYDSKNLAEITHFNINTGLKFSKPGRNLHKIFKGQSFHCQIFLDLKSLWKCSKLWEISIFVMKTTGFFIRFLAKVIRKWKWKNEK